MGTQQSECCKIGRYIRTRKPSLHWKKVPAGKIKTDKSMTGDGNTRNSLKKSVYFSRYMTPALLKCHIYC